MTIGEIMDFNYADGLEDGRTETLLSILSDLGEVSDELTERIHSLDPNDLKVWTKLAARADTMQPRRQFALYHELRS